ncbi:hypothetical protein SAM23877_0069 [Streptomyces ambofaciens ATCC 23877]|uniref:Uncharacterized protein n=1 Tax=Streptomyces ambofaciens (strain ATCC 23877 / 3486 / DSM 40053 / JCM 4204 / NBRC 12836 / NRRL B-2516) TaxID=278992 RepID=A0A0K2AJD8_STRA7|nr:hypothetical protein SAM23877_0069 [Streptomyces ambofaciens ATCC 23877]
MMETGTDPTPLQGARYRRYVDHIQGCTMCGRTRCPVGQALCAAYLAHARSPVRTALPARGSG